MEEKKNTIQHAIYIYIFFFFFCCTIPKLTKIKNLQKSVTSLKFNINTNNYEKSQRQGPNFVRSNQESLGSNSLVINTNDTTKEKK